MKLTPMYYKLRIRLKKNKYQPSAIKKARLLYPERKPEEIVREEDEKMLKSMCICFMGTIFICLIYIMLKGNQEGSLLKILMLVFLGVLAEVLIIVKRSRDGRNELDRRNDELREKYPELTSKMSILIGAGLSVRKTFEKIISDYRFQKDKNKNSRSFLYEEMELWLRHINQGISESEAFVRFGQRVGLPEYLRLISIIESSRKNGRTEFKNLLSLEAKNAFETRILLAKRRGEKISSKLLFPMIVLFVLVIGMLIIPAFMSF